MKRMALMLALTLLVGMALGVIGNQMLNAQQRTPPAEEKGRTVKTLASLDLGPQIEAFKGYRLRVFTLTMEPGGTGKLHSHKDRPLVFHILQGTFTDCRPDGTCTDLHEGQAMAEGKDLVHWTENRGPNPVKVVACDISKP